MVDGFIQLIQIVVDAIKAKTDSLTFTTTNRVDATILDYSTGTIVEDTTTATPNITTLQTSASANTWGTIVERNAAVASDVYVNSISVTPDSPGNYCIELLTGAGGAEVTKIHYSFVATSAGSSFDESFDQSFISLANTVNFNLTRSIKIPSGTRIALKVSCGEAGQRTVYASVQYGKD